MDPCLPPAANLRLQADGRGLTLLPRNTNLPQYFGQLSSEPLGPTRLLYLVKTTLGLAVFDLHQADES